MKLFSPSNVDRCQIFFFLEKALFSSEYKFSLQNEEAFKKKNLNPFGEILVQVIDFMASFALNGSISEIEKQQ